MKTQFTKGEWVARINQLGIDVFERMSGFGIVDFGNENTLFECDYPKEEAEANARLISAAPDFFDALLNIENDDKTETNRPGLGFGVNVFTGVDVYLCKGLYLGFELGLGYDSMNYKRGTTTTVSGSTTTETDGTTSNLQSRFGFHATPSLRVGWNF